MVSAQCKLIFNICLYIRIKTQASMCLAGFETAIKASEQQQIQVLGRAASGAGHYYLYGTDFSVS